MVYNGYIHGDSKLTIQISWGGREYVRKQILHRKVYMHAYVGISVCIQLSTAPQSLF